MEYDFVRYCVFGNIGMACVRFYLLVFKRDDSYPVVNKHTLFFRQDKPNLFTSGHTVQCPICGIYFKKSLPREGVFFTYVRRMSIFT